MTLPPAFEGGALQTGAIYARGLHYTRAGRTILDGVTLSVQPGESLAVMGPSGSGKSSLLALLADLELPDLGEVVRDQPAGRLGLVLQGYGLVSLLTAAENVEVPLQAGPTGGTGSKRLSPEQIQQRAAALIARVGLAEVADHLTEQLSGGQQQRVAIARAMVVEPDVVLADELTAELDHEWKHRVLDLVLDIAGRGGIVVLATHDPDVAARCDRVLRLESGHLHPTERTDEMDTVDPNTSPDPQPDFDDDPGLEPDPVHDPDNEDPDDGPPL